MHNISWTKDSNYFWFILLVKMLSKGFVYFDNLRIVLLISYNSEGCLRYCNTMVGSKCTLSASYGFPVCWLNSSKIYKANSLTSLNLEINPGFTDFIKNTSFSLLIQNSLIFGSKDWKSINKFMTGLTWSLKPFAKIWARYLLSFDNNATDSLAFSPKFLMITKIKSSNSDLEFFGSDRWSILLISTSAKLKLKLYVLLSSHRHSSLLWTECHKRGVNSREKCCFFDHLLLWCLFFIANFLIVDKFTWDCSNLWLCWLQYLE